jgi:organic radical activating enzyme
MKDIHESSKFDIVPNKSNFCGGAYQDWCDVVLTTKCNGSCKWCIEKYGYKPDTTLAADELADRVLSTGKNNISIVGGEPTLCLEKLVSVCRVFNAAGRNVYLTTNGCNIVKVCNLLASGELVLSQCNVSLHHYNMEKNRVITGVAIDPIELSYSVRAVRNGKTKYRANCNLCIGGIDTNTKVKEYIQHAVLYFGFHEVKFAELSFADDDFVRADSVFEDVPELSLEPFQNGCNHSFNYEGSLIHVKRVCGRHTKYHPECATWPSIEFKKCVVYPDGRVFDHWPYQNPSKGETTMDKKVATRSVTDILERVKSGDLTVDEAAAILTNDLQSRGPKKDGCRLENRRGCSTGCG